MSTVPDNLRPGSERTIAISCPECAGVLNARAEGPRGHLTYECRVGHTFSLGELLTGKEEQLDERLWSTLVALEELHEMLDETGRAAESHGIPDAAVACRDRAERVREQRGQLRRIIERNRAVEVHDGLARIRAGSDPGRR
jgi:two-component system chemotaxis response regulator CheB